MSRAATTTVALRWLSIAIAGVALAFAVGPLKMVGDYPQFIIASASFYFIAVLSVNMLAGLCGIWSMGHTAYIALGAYVAANLTKYGVPLEVILVAAAAAAGILGFILGLSAGRFSVLYFGLLTMALALVTTEVVAHWVVVTGGDDGMKVGKAISIFLPAPIETKNTVVICVLLATAVYLIGDAVNASQFGRRWLAVKGQRTAAMAIGLKPHVENATAFGLSAAIASSSGVAMAFSVAFIDPVAFSLDASITLIVGTVVGGIGSSLGALVGSGFITAVPELARDALAVANFVYGGTMVVVLLFLRQGLVPAFRARIRRWRGSRHSQGGCTASGRGRGRDGRFGVPPDAARQAQPVAKKCFGALFRAQGARRCVVRNTTRNRGRSDWPERRRKNLAAQRPERVLQARKRNVGNPG